MTVDRSFDRDDARGMIKMRWWWWRCHDDDDDHDDNNNDDDDHDDEKEGLCVWVVSDMVRGITAWQEAITADSRIAFLHTATVENTKEILKKY